MSLARLRCWVTGHHALMRQKRLHGQIARPHAIVWECARCAAVLGETTIPIPEHKQFSVLVWELIERVRARVKARHG